MVASEKVGCIYTVSTATHKKHSEKLFPCKNVRRRNSVISYVVFNFSLILKMPHQREEKTEETIKTILHDWLKKKNINETVSQKLTGA